MKKKKLAKSSDFQHAYYYLCAKYVKGHIFWSEYIDDMELNSTITLFILLVFINLYHTLTLALSLLAVVAAYMYVVVVTGRHANHLPTPHPSLSFLP